jgi:hypothetical protein
LADDPPRAVIDKALKALGGEEKLTKFKAQHMKGKATLDIMGMTVSGTIESYAQRPDRFKNVLELNINGMKITQLQIMNQDKITMTVNGMAIPLNDAMREEFKQEAHAEGVTSLLPLKDDKYELVSLGESKVGEHAAVGIKITREGYREITLHFDAQNGLLVKSAYKVTDPMTNREYLQESYFSDYKESDGIKEPRKVRAERDGKKLLEYEITEAEHLEKIDDKVFEP